MDTESPGYQSLIRLELEAGLAGRYALERELGQGGMGIVFLARDLSLDRLVAIKVLPPSLAQFPAYRERFLRETRTAAGFSHPHIVPIHSVEEHSGILFFVMGYVEGDSLGDRISRAGPLPTTEVSRVLREIGWALAYAHGRGVVHRDVKADNILLERASGRALLTDFGIARVPDSSMTGPGASLGTPLYMSPEQASGDPLDGRSDLYSLGVVGFYALTGRLPFEGDSPQTILAMHLSKPAPPVARLRPDVPRRLADAVDRCLRKDPRSRWPTADALVAALPVEASSFAEAAPQVRNFHRAASLALNQVLLMGVTLPILAILRPGAADLLLLLLVLGSAAVVLQLRGRAVLLASQGYTYEDLQAAVLAEQRQRGEEAAALRAALGPTAAAGGRPGAVFWLALLAGIGLVVLSLTTRGAETTALHRLEFAAGVGLVAATLIVRGAGSPQRRRGLGSLVARFWAGRGGQVLFAWLSRRAHRLGTPAVALVPSGDTAAALERLTPDHRKAHEAVRHVLADLGVRREELARREQAIVEALESAEWRSAAASEESADRASQVLLARRGELVAEMRAAREEVHQALERLEMAAENLQLQLSRLAAGLGTPVDALKDVDVARALLG